MIDWKNLKAANAPLNAFIDWDESANGGDGPLAGLTIGVKANIMVKGLPWTGGMAIHRERIAERDAKVVASLRDNGAAIIGTLNMDESALGAKTDNPWFGATQNPHRPGHTPGGSSGGSGAAVAAGLCDAALGTDTMGSIRIPASYCGVYGFKPAHAAVSQDGLELTEPSLDTIGPLARNLDVLEQVVRVISDFGAGTDPAPDAWPLGSLAVMAGVDCSPDVEAVFEKVETALGGFAPFTLACSAGDARFAGFIAASRWLAELLAGADPQLVSPALTKLLQYGPRRSKSQLCRDRGIVEAARKDIRRVVDKFGAMVLPTAPQAAFPHSEAAPANQADLTCLANIAGLPAISIPAGWSADGLPIGVQIVGKTGHEAGLFALARRLDAALDAYRPPAIFGY